MVISSDGQITPEQRREIRARYKQYQGFTKAHGLIIMDQSTKIESVGLSQKDMEFLEQRKLSREEILAIFKVPPAKAGILENANYSNSKENLVFVISE